MRNQFALIAHRTVPQNQFHIRRLIRSLGGFNDMPFGRSAIQCNVITLFMLRERRRIRNQKGRRHLRAAAYRAQNAFV